ncbi:MAG: FUSC family protein [Chroococcidiopsidaceae cyanobacterium CP_BM_ER_R8_30]|nr:FUSC family protein [Chroococcidiopsidaceae cyanobacterium CP_BM_ER_R8_30]
MLRSRTNLLRTIFQLEPGKPAIAKGMRAAIATVLPIGIIEYTGWSSLVWTALGGFETSIADVGGLHRTKATSMGLVALGGAISMLVGTLVGKTPFWAVLLAFLWTCGCGMAGIYGNAISTATTLIASIFLIALGLPSNFATAIQRSEMFLIGAILVMFLALVLWPLRPYAPVRMAVGECYQQLAELMRATFLLAAQPAARSSSVADSERDQITTSEATWNIALSQQRIKVREALTTARTAISRTRATRQGASVLGQRLLALTEIADQLFISTAALSEVLESYSYDQPWEQSQVHTQHTVEQVAKSCRTLAAAISSSRSKASVNLWELDRALEQLKGSPELPPATQERKLKGELQHLRQATSQRQVDYSMFLIVNHIVGLVDRLVQYTHAAADIALESDRQRRRRSQSTTVELELALLRRGGWGRCDRPLYPPCRSFLRRSLEWNQSPRALEVLRNNLTLNSAVFRHALRLGVTTAVAVIISSLFGLKEGYWVTLTVVVILKPYSGATFQRGLQRVLGTVSGGILAVILAAKIHSPLVIAFLLFPLTVTTLALQPINYGLFVFFLTPQVILMDNVLHPGNWLLALDRIENTAIGGALALIGGYLLWPSREHQRLPDQFATTITANGIYFQTVLAKYLGQESEEKSIQKALNKARLENTNAEVSFQRLLSEPHQQRNNLEPLIAILSTIHQFNYAVTTLAAHLSERSSHHQLPGLERFAQQVEDLLADLSNSLHMAISPQILPGLEETQNEIAAHIQKLHAGQMEELFANHGNTALQEVVLDYSLVGIEVKRIVRIVTIMHSAICRMYETEVMSLSLRSSQRGVSVLPEHHPTQLPE